MYIRIEPSVGIFTSTVGVRPLLPGDLYVYNLDSSDLYDAHTGSIIDSAMDNRGIRWRMDALFDPVSRDYLINNNCCYILFSCPEYNTTLDEVSNKLIVYDAINNKGVRVNPNRVSSIFSDISPDLLIPPIKVLAPHKITSLYDKKDKFLFWLTKKLPRPLIVFPYEHDSEDIVYGMIDPFVQWSPSRYMTDNPFPEIPRNIDGWIHTILGEFNWEYFAQLMTPIEGKVVDIEYFVASIFDILYDEYIYYAVCSKLWPNQEKKKKDIFKESGHLMKILRGPSMGEQTVLNFTDIVDTIYGFIKTNVFPYMDDLDPEENEIALDSDTAANKIAQYIQMEE